MQNFAIAAFFLIASYLENQGALAVPGGKIFCSTGRPATGSNNDTLGYTITAPESFEAGDSAISITVNADGFQGLFLRVLDSSNEVSGTFTDFDEDLFEYIPCVFDQPSSTVIHINDGQKSSSTFEWNPPEKCNGETYKVRATIVKDLLVYQENVSALMSCIPDDDDEVESTCKFAAATNVPDNNYTTSFEGETPFDNWINGYGASSEFGIFGWLQIKGSVPAGPEIAADGEYYLYTNAVSRDEGDVTVLRSNKGFRGCFCLKFKKYQNVSTEEKHVLRVTGDNGITYYSSETSSPEWQDVFVQFDLQDDTQIFISNTRGSGIYGDIAIDDIEITPGQCSDDEEDEEEEEESDEEDDTDEDDSDSNSDTDSDSDSGGSESDSETD